MNNNGEQIDAFTEVQIKRLKTYLPPAANLAGALWSTALCHWVSLEGGHLQGALSEPLDLQMGTQWQPSAPLHGAMQCQES